MQMVQDLFNSIKRVEMTLYNIVVHVVLRICENL